VTNEVKVLRRILCDAGTIEAIGSILVAFLRRVIAVEVADKHRVVTWFTWEKIVGNREADLFMLRLL
jgi:hypothetical protein